LWACTVAPAQFAVSEDGATFAPVLAPDEVEERACPDDTFAAQVCVYTPIEPEVPDEFGAVGFADAAPLEVVDEPVVIDEPIDNVRSEPSGCTGGGVPFAFVLALFVVRRRACYC
jgi:hypothetical protein